MQKGKRSARSNPNSRNTTLPTAKPHLTSDSNSVFINSKRSNSLYDSSKSYRKKADRRCEDIEFEKQRKELTFVPRILKKNAHYRSGSSLNAKITEAIERMQRARQVIAKATNRKKNALNSPSRTDSPSTR
eukprot:TRINITY_DN16698_c0_g1_i1.p1 TRINITY_DN16698_c0_g1~~TRINITY_DN16698_c0_g1_i1.p1  ORF type:complete len:131 (+),score=4.73 TRINITY_DN16698_c0_g1_i1:38-430(+)